MATATGNLGYKLPVESTSTSYQLNRQFESDTGIGSFKHNVNIYDHGRLIYDHGRRV